MFKGTVNNSTQQLGLEEEILETRGMDADVALFHGLTTLGLCTCVTHVLFLVINQLLLCICVGWINHDCWWLASVGTLRDVNDSRQQHTRENF